jgi:hypothetical protein
MGMPVLDATICQTSRSGTIAAKAGDGIPANIAQLSYALFRRTATAFAAEELKPRKNRTSRTHLLETP